MKKWQSSRWFLGVALGAMLAGPAFAQPVITGALTSSPSLTSGATGPAAITNGTPLGEFTLNIPGIFDPVRNHQVVWTNTATGITTVLAIQFENTSWLSASSSQVIVNIPGSLYNFSEPITAAQRVNVFVRDIEPESQVVRTSNAATFTINPPMQGAELARAITQGTAYSIPLTTGGTPPFSLTTAFGSPPPGLTVEPGGATLAGTPTTLGVYNVGYQITDAWANLTSAFVTLRVVPVPVITAIAPRGALVGSPPVQLTITGSNFIPALQFSAFQSETQGGFSYFEGSVVIWTVGTGEPVVLATQFVSSTQLTATIPASLLTQPVTAAIQVEQPSGAVSNAAPFYVYLPLTIVTSALAPGTLNVAYTAGLTASGGALPLVWSAQGLPPGLALNSATGAITGTPTTLGQFTVGVAVQDVLGQTATRSLALSIVPPVLSIVTTALTAGAQGQAYTGAVTAAGGLPPLTWSAQGLPPGLAINSATGAITGTPSAMGNYTPTFTVADSAQQSVSRQIPLTIGPPPLNISTTSLPNATMGAAYSAAVAATGGIAPLVWSVQGLPSGLALNSGTGAITGTPTSFGNFSPTFTVRDNVNQTASRQIPLTVALPPLSIIPSIAPGQQNTPYIGQLQATGGVPPLVWSVQGLPSGFTLIPASGQVTGVPAAQGTFPFSATVRDAANQTATAQIQLTIGPPPIPPVTFSGSGTLPQGTVGVLYGASIEAAGGVPEYRFGLSGGSLPPGLALNTNGAIFGTPATAGRYAFQVTVSDTRGETASQGYEVVIVQAPVTVTGTVADAPAGSAISVPFGATGGVPPYTFTAGGTLPPGTTFANGTLTGTPATPGTYPFTVTARDSRGVSATRAFTMVVTAPVLTLTGSAGNGTLGQAYTAQFAVTGGTPPYTFSASGLPAGLSLGGNTISGTPTAPGTFDVGITVTDAAGNRTSRTFSVTIAVPPLTVSTTALPAGVAGSAYTAAVSASGGAPPYSWSIGGLPGGLTGNASGAISGTPSAAGDSTVAATVTDSRGTTASRNFTLTITVAPLSITTASVPAGTVGTAVSLTFAATGGTPPYTWSAAGLPAGLSLSPAGALSGSPAAPGTTTFSVAVTDSTGGSASRQFSFTAALPTAPPLTVAGLPPASNPTTQPRLTVALGTAYPVDVAVTLTLTFTADSGPDDPTNQFSTGGRTAQIIVRAGSTTGVNDVGVQLGTVAGTVTITARLNAAGQDVTPSPAPTRTIRINGGPPVITSVTATRSGSGFTVAITGFAPSREVTTANFQFTAASGSNLQTTQLSVPVGALFAPYFQSAAGVAMGSQFTFTQPFTVQGTAPASVSVTLAGAAGTSNTVSANVQ